MVMSKIIRIAIRDISAKSAVSDYADHFGSGNHFIVFVVDTISVFDDFINPLFKIGRPIVFFFKDMESKAPCLS